ncbi:hypothetical protein LJCM5344_08890 [Lactobacillus paragasseri]|nr:hypothetical protein LJCM5344_08890 [Lactobacillus paragasseri]
MIALVRQRRSFYFQMLAKLILKINLKLLNSSKIDSDRIESENIYLAGFINEKK